MSLELERRDQQDKTVRMGGLMMTPKIDEDYWAYRVRLSDQQAIVGFPKFGTIGIGFAVETDWNTNLPYTSPAEEIYAHIKHNKGDRKISDEDCLEAIRLIQEAAKGTNPYGEALRDANRFARELYGSSVYAVQPTTDSPDPHQPFLVKLHGPNGPTHYIQDGRLTV